MLGPLGIGFSLPPDTATGHKDPDRDPRPGCRPRHPRPAGGPRPQRGPRRHRDPERAQPRSPDVGGRNPCSRGRGDRRHGRARQFRISAMSRPCSTICTRRAVWARSIRAGRTVCSNSHRRMPRAMHYSARSPWSSRWPAGSACVFCCVRAFREGDATVHRRVCCEGPVFALEEALGW